jgi:hypothetical protein
MLETKRDHRSMYVLGKSRLVIPALGAVGMARSAQVKGHYGKLLGEHGHDLSPFPPGLRKAMEENKWRAIASNHSMNFHVAHVHHTVTETL